MVCMKTNFVYNFRFLRKSKSLPIQIIASTEIHEKVMPNILGAWSTMKTNMNHNMLEKKVKKNYTNILDIHNLKSWASEECTSLHETICNAIQKYY